MCATCHCVKMVKASIFITSRTCRVPPAAESNEAACYAGEVAEKTGGT